MTAEVIVDIVHGEVDKIFEYVAIDGVCEGSRVKVPFGGRVADGFVMRIKEGSDYSADKLKKILSVVDDVPALTPECLALAGAIAERYRCPKALVLRLFLPAEMRKGTVREIYKTYAVFANETQIPARAKAQISAYDFMQNEKRFGFTELCDKFGRSAVNALVEKGALALEKERIVRSPYKNTESGYSPHELTPSQKSAVLNIENSDKTVQLLHGVTGSGKTEIYLKLIAETLKKGKSAIFLVPEISLTPQKLTQLRARFGEKAAILHSGLSAGEKFDE